MRHEFKDKKCIYCEMRKDDYLIALRNVITMSRKVGTDFATYELKKDDTYDDLVNIHYPCLTDEEWEVKQIIL